MSRLRKYAMILLCSALAAGTFVPSFLRAQTPTTAPAKTPRPAAAIQADLQAATESLNQIIPYPQAIGEAKFRKESGEKAIPVLRKMADLFAETGAENIKYSAVKRLQCLSMAVALGDKESAKLLTDMAAAKSPDEVLDPKFWLVLGNWVNASEDAAVQQKVLDTVTAFAAEASKTLTDLLAEKNAFNADNLGKPLDAAAQKKVTERDAAISKANQRQEVIADTLIIMSQMGAANDDMSKKSLAVIKSLNSDSAKAAALRIDSDKNQRNFIGRPMVLVGRTVAGAQFNSKELRGKVVLVDFWATWCPPCRAAMPGVLKIYADYHEKGLEIVGVNCDSDDGKVNKFTKENKMEWPQLREQSQTDDDNEHPLAKRYGVDAIPTVFLIDRKGILRYVDGDIDMENKIKKLLEEVDPKAPKPAPVTPPAAVPAPAPAAPPAPAPAK